MYLTLYRKIYDVNSVANSSTDYVKYPFHCEIKWIPWRGFEALLSLFVKKVGD